MKKLWLAGILVGALALTGTAMGQATRGVSGTEIVLGMHTDLSGPAATYGVSSSNAVKMRFDEVNEKGGIHGRKIKLIIEDSSTSSARVQAGTSSSSATRSSRWWPGSDEHEQRALQGPAGRRVPNLFPLWPPVRCSSPPQVKFYGAATTSTGARRINYFVTKRARKRLRHVSGTPTSARVVDGVAPQAEKMS